MNLSAVLIILVQLSQSSISIDFNFSAQPGSVDVTSLPVENGEFHSIGIPGFQSSFDGIIPPGAPAMPHLSRSFLLAPGTVADSIIVNSETWVSIPGFFVLQPRQFDTFEEYRFVPPDPAIYSSIEPFPPEPVAISRQGSAMGFQVVTLSGYPLRYTPSSGQLEVLTSISVSLKTSPSTAYASAPLRESIFSSGLRLRGIESLVSNPEDIGLYPVPAVETFSGETDPLAITEFPSPQGNCVDMVIVTSDGMEELFQQLADHRTRQGIVTTVRTVQWIEQHYGGSDTPERIRNFLQSAHQNWGIQAVLLGGDDSVVPVRQTGGWEYVPVPYPSYQLPSDDYYGDLDGNWSYDGSVWRVISSPGFLDLCTGRWPVNNASDFETMFEKLLLYENPADPPESFARRILLMGSNNPAGSGADHLMELAERLRDHSVPRYLDEPVELYYPHSLPAGDLNRNNALAEFDQGYNLVIHSGHSEIHKLGTAGSGTLGQYMWDSDFSTMENIGKPSILWTLGCDAGHFDGAYSFAEAGLLTSWETGLSAVISNARGGLHSQISTARFFCDALFDTGHIAELFQYQGLNWPLSFLGEAHRASKNLSGSSYMFLNLLGSPMMGVWRDDPDELTVSCTPFFAVEGVPVTVTATVTDGSIPVADATVCLWKHGELFSIQHTDQFGKAFFPGVAVAGVGGSDQIQITATKFRDQLNQYQSTTASWLPGMATLDILPSQTPLVSLMETFPGQPGPGETIDIQFTAVNTGGETAQGVSAQLSVIEGSQFISSIPVDQAMLPDIPPDEWKSPDNPFTVSIAPDAPGNAVIEFGVVFTYSGAGGTHQWESSFFLTVMDSDYSAILIDPTVDNSSGTTADIVLENLLVANAGPGDGGGFSMTIHNLSPREPFTVDTVYSSGIPANSANTVEGSLTLTVFPQHPNSDWLREGFSGCSFDVVAETPAGISTLREVDASLVAFLQNEELDPPHSISVYETGEDHIALTWKYSGGIQPSGYYVYADDGTGRRRVNPLPIPVKQITIDGLQPGSSCQVEVTAVDLIGREGPPAIITASTSCQAVSGWPVYLYGSPGSGALAADLDSDGLNEIAAISSFGTLRVIERNGTFQEFPPPAGYDFDRFLGFAAGDVTGDGRTDIVVTCQRKIGVPGQERVTVLLYSRPAMIWHVQEIATTGPDEELASTITGGTPVLFQADDSPQLEIALRTRGSSGNSPKLHVWRYDEGQNGWVDYSQDFPVQLSGGFFDSPSAADYDEDGFDELIATSYSAGEPGTDIVLVDFEAGGVVQVTEHDLYELNTGGYIARVFGTLAVAEENGTFYIAGTAKPESFCSDFKNVFVCRITDEPSPGIVLQWQTGWITGHDFFGNMPGPVIGEVDGEEGLDVIYTLNSGSFNSEGIIAGWKLDSGTPVYQSPPTPFNPIQGGGGSDIKSQPVTGLTSAPGSGITSVFSGFSTLFSGADPLSDGLVAGFPGYSRDAVWGAPVVCDLNADGAAEVLFIDFSGRGTLYDTAQFGYMETGWHMYQANPSRTGFYTPARAEPQLDIALALPTETPLEGFPPGFIPVTVIITGHAQRPRAAMASRGPQVRVDALRSGQLLGTAETPLENGRRTVLIPLGRTGLPHGEISLVADPLNVYEETSKANNTAVITSPCQSEETVTIPSPASELEITLVFTGQPPKNIEITVYSIDGRIVSTLEPGELSPGSTTLRPSGRRHLPAGIYTVRISGLTSEYTRRVVIL